VLARNGFKRMFLHAASVGVKHPASGAKLVIEAPLPSELKKFVEKLE
jgi:23S rRNA pseudouridine955/2504/2580 synthase